MADGKNEQARAWLITINNPKEHGWGDREKLIEQLMLFNPDYFCLADEIGGETRTYHTHVYLHAGSPMRFGTLKKRFPTAHLDKAYGSPAQNRDYIRKEGAWAGHAKAETRVEGSFYEHGGPPPGKGKKNEELLESVRSGKSTTEIVSENSDLALHVREINALRNAVKEDLEGKRMRSMNATYLHGPCGAGKTRLVYDSFGAANVYRMSVYGKGRTLFDGYAGEKVLLLDNFYGQIDMGELVSYLEAYPLALPARYSNKVACYDTVYIVSEIPLWEQYAMARRSNPRLWRSLLRKIDRVAFLTEDGELIERKGGRTDG